MRWPWQKEGKGFESVLQRIVAQQEGNLGGDVTPENCMRSPTVHAIVTAVSRRLASSPIHVYRKGMDDNGRETKELLPNHPVTRLLAKPNDWQSPHDFWLDATSSYLRWGNFYAFKGRGSTGPIRRLIPLFAQSVKARQDDNYIVTYEVTERAGGSVEYGADRIFHARGPARNYFNGDSPIADVRTAIALEILAERFGAAFFQNGAVPLLVFSFLAGSRGFESAEQEREFISSFQDAFSNDKKHKAMLLPAGMDKPDPVAIDHDKAQFLETRRYQRTVIAGAFGVPPHLVGDLERGTFNNVEQQDKDFTANVVMPVAKSFESAMERDLLTDADRASNICVRFNLDSILRADFLSRQQGLKIQREAGVISPNEWREREGMNPRENGDEYWEQGPSGQAPEESDEEAESTDSAGNQESQAA